MIKMTLYHKLFIHSVKLELKLELKLVLDFENGNWLFWKSLASKVILGILLTIPWVIKNQDFVQFCAVFMC